MWSWEKVGLERVGCRGKNSIYSEHKSSNCPLCVFSFHCDSILNKNLCHCSLGFHYFFISNNSIYWVSSLQWAHSGCSRYRGEKDRVSALVEVGSNAATIAVLFILFSQNPNDALRPWYLRLTCQNNMGVEQHVLTHSLRWFRLRLRLRQNPPN